MNVLQWFLLELLQTCCRPTVFIIRTIAKTTKSSTSVEKRMQAKFFVKAHLILFHFEMFSISYQEACLRDYVRLLIRFATCINYANGLKRV